MSISPKHSTQPISFVTTDGGHFTAGLELWAVISVSCSRTVPSELWWLCADQRTHDNLVLMHRKGHFGLDDPTPMPLITFDDI
jgi:hypothetical protein